MPFTIGGDWVPKEEKPSNSKKIKIIIQKVRGKPVTRIVHLNLNPKDIKTLESFLKRHCHCGGSSKETQIELSGDHCEKVKELLIKYDGIDNL